MTFDELYETLKEGLKFLGLGWGDKGLARLYMDGDNLVLQYRSKTISVTIPKKP